MRHGGSYTKEGSGEPKLVERTQDHPDGNRARDAQDKPLPVKPATSGAPAKALRARPATDNKE